MKDRKEQTQKNMIITLIGVEQKTAVGATYRINKHESQNPEVGSKKGYINDSITNIKKQI